MNEVYVCYLRDAKRLYGNGIGYATAGSAGMDLRACIDCEEMEIAPGERVPVPSGISIEPRDGTMAGFVYSRSGLGAVKGLAVAQGVGVIDTDYRGEIVVWLLNTSHGAIHIRRGDRVAQLVFQPVCRARAVTVESLTETERGNGGFGHTGQD